MKAGLRETGARFTRIMAIVAMLALVAAGCGSGGGSDSPGDGTAAESVTEADSAETTSEASANQESVEISLAIIVDNLPVDENVQGFKEQMQEAGYVEGENIEYRERNAFGQIDQSELIARQSYQDDPDLIYVVGTPIVNALYQINEDIPTVFSLMTDPVGGGVVESLEEPGRNFTGTSDAIEASVFFDALETLVPDAQTVGMLGNTAEQNTQTQIDEFTAEAESRGIQLEVAPVESTNRIVPAVTSLEGRVDAVMVGADGTVVSGSDTVIQATRDAGLPLIIQGSEFASDGALAGIGPDFHQLGVASAEIVIDILENGSEPEQIPVIDAVSGGGLTVAVNPNTAESIEVEVPSELPEEYTVIDPEA